MSIEGGEEHQIAPDIVEVFATRGDDGLFGVDIMVSPSHQISENASVCGTKSSAQMAATAPARA